MRIRVRLPKIQPDEYDLPKQSPYEGCSGDTFKPHDRQSEAKAVRDTDNEQMQAHRYRCTTCGRPSRMIYPPLMPKGVKSGYKQIEQDCQILQHLVRECPSDAKAILEALYTCYEAASNPKYSIWYRMKRLILKLWTRWERITLAENHAHLDGTNNTCERLIGWWIKERYRTMRGHKRTLSIRNVVAVTSLLGAASEPYDMALLHA
jgi:hypothetical protein